MSNGRCKEAMFSATTPHFFKIVLEETIRENILSIPKKFVRVYGKTLSKHVHVKLPCGAKWKMKLSDREGKIWLNKGWPEFAKHYSIVLGHMLIFRYEGNSQFHVVIFDTSAVEIDYPSVQFNELDIEEELQLSKRKTVKDDSEDMLDDSEAGSHPRKRLRTSRTDETQSNTYHPRPYGHLPYKRVLEISDKKGNSTSPKFKMEGKHKLPARNADRKSMRTCMKRLNNNKKIAALEKASAFTSKHPFFKVVIQPYYVHSSILSFQTSFARRYLKYKSGDGVLKLRNKRKTWLIKYSSEVYRGGPITRFHCGWKEFARSNNLEVGDVCVFVLLSRTKVLFEVIIYRANEVPKAPMSSALYSGEPLVEIKESSRRESESDIKIKIETNTNNLCGNLAQKLVTRRTSTLCKTSLASKAKGQKTSFSRTKKARCLERVQFVSEKPFFKVLMQPSYVYPGLHMPVPSYFAERYIENEGEVDFRVPNRGFWSVQFKIWHQKSGRVLAEFCKGWRLFAEGNNLEVGDICVFELIDGPNVSFHVHIYRISDEYADIDAHRPRHQDNKPRIHTAAGSLQAKRASQCTPTSGKRSHNTEAIARKKFVTTDEKARLTESAYFESERPFFKIIMQPSYTGLGYHLPIPSEFARKYIKTKCRDVILLVPHSTKTWRAQLQTRRSMSGRVRAYICNGWKKFAKCNNLKLGDVGIFELIDETAISFQVSIIQAPNDDLQSRWNEALSLKSYN